MPIPDFQSIMLPLLKFSSDQKEHTVRETEEYLANVFKLTKEEREEMLPSGTTRTFVNRVAWTKAHLMKAGLITSPRRSVYKITQRGMDVLKGNPGAINVAFLKRFEEYREFLKPSKEKGEPESGSEIESSVTPRETFENAYQLLRKQLLQEVLEKVKEATPKFFEEIVVELLVKMGYGGSVEDAGKATRFTNDEGIDGIIKEDKLGLDVIYIQAKKWTENPIGRPEIQAFVGALDGKHANKGIFITTSRFSDGALSYVKSISKKVVLIDGIQLANFMIDYGLGVSTYSTFELKRVDNDYFEE